MNLGPGLGFGLKFERFRDTPGVWAGVTVAIAMEDVMDNLFRTFCVGEW